MTNQGRVFEGKHLPLETTLYVPSTDAKQRIIPENKQAQRVMLARRKMSQLFGGYTSVRATGGWISGKKRLIREPVFKVTSFSEVSKFKRNKGAFVKNVKDWGKAWGQQQMSVEYEGDMYWINPASKPKKNFTNPKQKKIFTNPVHRPHRMSHTSFRGFPFWKLMPKSGRGAL
jgi:hypothetical protein